MAKKKCNKVKTHSFRLGTYHIEIWDSHLLGLCDHPDSYYKLRIAFPNDNTLESLKTIIHECCHAEGIKDEVVDTGMGERIATLLWRLGWRKEGDE